MHDSKVWKHWARLFDWIILLKWCFGQVEEYIIKYIIRIYCIAITNLPNAKTDILGQRSF